jgi:hypothetical protein
MPSVATVRRESRASRTLRRRLPRVRRALSGFWALAVLGLTLAGCATGQMDEARIAETREATRGAILDDVQATNVVKEFFKPTATPLPTSTPVPTLATLTLSTQLGSNNQPVNEVGSVRQGARVYAVAEIHDLREGQTVTAVWTTEDGGEVGRSDVSVDRSLGAAWVPLEWTANVGFGNYAVYVYVDDRLLNSLVFRVN